MLERLDPTQQMYEAKRGAAVGAFQLVVAGKEEVGGLDTSRNGMTGRESQRLATCDGAAPCKYSLVGVLRTTSCDLSTSHDRDGMHPTPST